jgi:archaellum biogenesis protein FlaJ (TadC family)
MLILLYPSFAFALAFSPVNTADVYKVIYRPLALSIAVGVWMFWLRSLLISLHPLVVVCVVLLAGAIALLCLILAWPSAKADIFLIIDSFKFYSDKKKGCYGGQ